MKTSKKLLLSFLLLSASSNFIFAKLLKEEKRKLAKESGKKGSLTIESQDSKLRLGGIPKIEFLFYNNAVLLNSSIPDQSELFKQTLDFYADYAFGEKKYGHKAVEVRVEVRNKTKWGASGTYAESGAEDIKIDESYLDSHKHPTSRPMIWFRTAWMQFSLNSVFGFESDKLHFFKIGWFPFKLGRGISFGSNYGATKEYLGVYSRAEDKYAAGILLDGEIVKDKLAYDFYYSKIEERGSSIWDTFNTKKINHRDRRKNPWSGVAKDADLGAAKLVWTTFNNDGAGKLNLEPYGFYLAASDQKVEFEADAKAQLATFGLNLEYKKSNFEFGAEAAINTGYERLYTIDRNIAELKRWDAAPKTWGTNENSIETGETTVPPNPHKHTVELSRNLHSQGILRELNNHVEQKIDDPNTYASAPLNASNENEIMKKRYDNNYVMQNNLQDKNTSDGKTRFRPTIKHDLDGWFALADTSYLIKPWNLRVAGAYAYTSGDNHPHELDKDSRYNDFVGINEWYCGKRVPSVFLLCEKIIPQPLSITPNTKKVYVDNHFSNLQYFGFGLNWKPEITKSKKLRINPNALFFWRTSNSLKYDVSKAKGDAANEYKENFSDGVVLHSQASKYLGTELNLILETEPLPDLMFYGVFAAFVPGQFYKDIKGVRIQGTPDVFGSLDEKTREEVNLADYRLGDDTAVFIDVGIRYTF